MASINLWDLTVVYCCTVAEARARAVFWHWQHSGHIKITGLWLVYLPVLNGPSYNNSICVIIKQVYLCKIRWRRNGWNIFCKVMQNCWLKWLYARKFMENTIFQVCMIMNRSQCPILFIRDAKLILKIMRNFCIQKKLS